MFLELSIKNYALIEEVNLVFSPGLNILSGETGAGKSIIIGSINLLLGERASVEHVRRGAPSAYIEGIIVLSPALKEAVEPLFEEAGFALEDELIVAREIFENGRSVARVNGRAVPLSFLKELGSSLVDLHGQHEHQSLLKTQNHLHLLDAFGGDELLLLKEKLSALHQKRAELLKELKNLGETTQERERRLDILKFQLNEIETISPKPGEDEELREREKVLGNAEKLCSLTDEAYSDLYGGAMDQGLEKTAIIDRLHKSLRHLREAAEIDSTLSPWCDMLDLVAEQLSEASHELRDYQLRLEFEPGELAVLQERLNQISVLKKKYGSTIEAVLEFAEDLKEETERLLNSEELAKEIENELTALKKVIDQKASKLSVLRKKTALYLEEEIKKSLEDLALADASFKVAVRDKKSFTPEGKDEVEFLFSANRGEEVKALAKIISGGEVSRVMLALKTVLADQDKLPTLIFDEVDSGVGGVTIQAVAEKLAALSSRHQVMCVTHSPQVAAMADAHFYLHKEIAQQRTVTKVKLLGAREQQQELARMLDGAPGDSLSLKHVENLLQRADKFKKGLKK